MAINKAKRLTISEAAKLTGMLPQTLRKLAAKGALEGARLKKGPFGDPFWTIPEITLLKWKPRARGWPTRKPAVKKKRKAKSS